MVITWDVDFNAMEGSDPVLRGSFNLTTLKKAGGAGRQGARSRYTGAVGQGVERTTWSRVNANA